ncbi:MAG TPA: nodulation protein NfeD [bacterium]|nr:nodulation protein NfeD [bacterium]
MRALWPLLLLGLALVAPAADAGPPDPKAPAARSVYRITIDGTIAPSTARFIQRAINEAEAEDAEALIISLDTPGGLLKSTDDITKAILNARVPVVVHIAPRGARAASAGVFITYASHIAAMAHATHLGAATPVSMGGGERQSEQDRTLMNKVMNDSVANIRAMARRRGRNADWGEKAVREAVSITEEEALALNVINLIAADTVELIRKLDGRSVETARGPVVLRTAGARVIDRGMDLTERFLALLADPNIGFILMNVGILGIMVELYNPGAILPGVVGGISLILGLASFAILQVNAAGLLLIGFAILLFIADIKVPGHGVLTVGGVIAFIFGAILLTERQAPVLQISLRLIIAVATVLAAFFLFAVGAGIRAQKAAPRSGGERLTGAVGVARSRLDPEGMVHVQGEMWTAVAVDGPIDDGQTVRVVALDGLRLRVKPEPRPST